MTSVPLERGAHPDPDDPTAEAQADEQEDRWQSEEDAREAHQDAEALEADPDAFAEAVEASASLARGADEEDTDEFTRYLREVVRGQRPLTKAEALQAASEGDTDLLIERNVLLVVDIALKWAGVGRSLMDLIGAGNVGLTLAATRFKPELGYAFSTFSFYHIRGAVRDEALRQDLRYLSMPPSVQRTFLALHARRARLSREGGGRYSLADTAALLRERGVPPPTHQAPWPDAGELSLWNSAVGVRYLTQMVAPTVKFALHGTWPVARRPTYETALSGPGDALERAEAKADIWQLRRDLGTLLRYRVLAPREVQLLVLRFGIPHPSDTWRPPRGWVLGTASSAREAARMAGIPRETARLALKRALARLAQDPSEIARRASATLGERDIFTRYYASS